MSYTFPIHVHYPLRRGRMFLRADTDWGQDIEPKAVAPDRSVHHFELQTSRPFAYFKPVIRHDDRLVWSAGKNYLVTYGDADGRDTYPYFYSDPTGTVSDPIPVANDRGEVYRIRVYEPPGYRENTLKRYPVLYMHDGKNLFFPDEAFLGVEWEVDETMDRLNAMNAIKLALVVGIQANERERDYTPPGCKDYCRFIAKTLKPTVDHLYRTLPDARNTGVMGSSLGGLVSLELAWSYAASFGMAGCMSSTFQRDPDLIPRIVSEGKKPLKIYLDSGWPGDNYEITRCMRDALAAVGYETGKELLYLAFPGDPHNEHAWATRVHIPFQFFFARVPSFHAAADRGSEPNRVPG